jgi:hypothetical protein
METVHVYGANFFVLPGTGYSLVGADSSTTTATTTTVYFRPEVPSVVVELGGVSWIYISLPITASPLTLGDSITIPGPILSVAGASLVPQGSDAGRFEAAAPGRAVVVAASSEGPPRMTTYDVSVPSPPVSLSEFLTIDGAIQGHPYPFASSATFAGATPQVAPAGAQVSLDTNGARLVSWGPSDPMEVVATVAGLVIRFTKRASSAIVAAGVAVPLVAPGDAPADSACFTFSADRTMIVFNLSATASPRPSISGDLVYTVLTTAALSTSVAYDPSLTDGLAFVDYAPYNGTPLALGPHVLSYDEGTVIYATIVPPAGTPGALDLYYFGTQPCPTQISDGAYVATVRAPALVWHDPSAAGAAPVGIVPGSQVLNITPPTHIPGILSTPAAARFKVSYDGEFTFTLPQGNQLSIVSDPAGGAQVHAAGRVTGAGNLTVDETDVSGRTVAVYTLVYVMAYDPNNMTLLDGAVGVISDVASVVGAPPTSFFVYDSATKTVTVTASAPQGQLLRYVGTDGKRYVIIIARQPVPADHIVELTTYLGESVTVPATLTPPPGSGFTTSGGGLYTFTVPGVYLFSGSPISYRVSASGKSDFIRVPAVFGVNWSYTFSTAVSIDGVTVNDSTVPASLFTISEGGRKLSIAGSSLTVGLTQAVLQDGRTLVIDTSHPPGLALSKFCHDLLVLDPGSTLTNAAAHTDYLKEQGEGLYECIRVTTSPIELIVLEAEIEKVRMLDIVPRSARQGSMTIYSTVTTVPGTNALFIGDVSESGYNQMDNPQCAFQIGRGGFFGHQGSGALVVWDEPEYDWAGGGTEDQVLVDLELPDSFGNLVQRSFNPHSMLRIVHMLIGKVMVPNPAGGPLIEATTMDGIAEQTSEGFYHYITHGDAGLLSQNLAVATLHDVPLFSSMVVTGSSFAVVDAPIYAPGPPGSLIPTDWRFVGTSHQLVTLF